MVVALQAWLRSLGFCDGATPDGVDRLPGHCVQGVTRPIAQGCAN